MEIPAHKCVLASCSPYFYAMFTNELAEARAQRIEIKEVEGTALAQLVEFVYSSGEFCGMKDTVVAKVIASKD